MKTKFDFNETQMSKDSFELRGLRALFNNVPPFLEILFTKEIMIFNAFRTALPQIHNDFGAGSENKTKKKLSNSWNVGLFELFVYRLCQYNLPKDKYTAVDVSPNKLPNLGSKCLLGSIQMTD